METSDAQVSLGSDGIIESNPTLTSTNETTPATEIPSPITNKTSVNSSSFSPSLKVF